MAGVWRGCCRGGAGDIDGEHDHSAGDDVAQEFVSVLVRVPARFVEELLRATWQPSSESKAVV
jgi:hypothetical protein